jgi:hypothetical protein
MWKEFWLDFDTAIEQTELETLSCKLNAATPFQALNKRVKRNALIVLSF